jgi:hypothetical protein
MSTLIQNKTGSSLTLPAPFNVVLAPLQGLVFRDDALTVSEALASIGILPSQVGAVAVAGEATRFLATGPQLELHPSLPSSLEDWKQSVRASTTADIALFGLQTVDAVVLTVSDRVLVKNQAIPSENGVYLVSVGAWDRAADAVEGALSSGGAMVVEEGTQAGRAYVLATANPIVVGTTDLVWSQLGGGGGGGGDVTGPGSSTDNAVTRFSGATGTMIKNSNVIVQDNGAVALTGAALTTQTSLDIPNLDALTSGRGINVASGSADPSARDLVRIANSAGAGTVPLRIVNAGPAVGIRVDGAGSGLQMADRPSVPVPGAGYGTYYPGNTVPSTPRFADSTGDDRALVRQQDSFAAGFSLLPHGVAAGNTTEFKLRELAANGAHYVALKAPDSVPASLVLTMPAVDGAANDVLVTNGAGGLSFIPVPTPLTVAYKPSVRAATSVALPTNTQIGLTLTASAVGALPAIDGVTLLVGDTLLVKNEGGGSPNALHGLYTVTDAGSGATVWVLTRRADADVDPELVSGSATIPREGTAQAGTLWVLSTPDPITIGTTAQDWTQLATAGWNLAGNAGTSPALHFIGTLDAQPVVFRANNAEVARLPSGGGLGVGVTALLGGERLRAATASGAGTPILGLQNTTGDIQFFLGSGTPEAVVTGSRGDLYMDIASGTLYAKAAGDATNTGWSAFTASAGDAVTAVQVAAYAAGIGELVRVNPTAGTFTVTLPAIAGGNSGRVIKIANVTASLIPITVAVTGADTINGAASFVVSGARFSFAVESDGTSDWIVF